ncbi:hypothetical protein [Lactococcus petauri]
MSELEKTKQEVEQVCFAYEKAGKTGNIKDWGKFYDLEDSLINKVEVANQTKLSIPKKIADALDVGDLMVLAWTHANDLLGKVSDEERKSEVIRRNALARAYLAGKALGVELVEVER